MQHGRFAESSVYPLDKQFQEHDVGAAADENAEHRDSRPHCAPDPLVLPSSIGQDLTYNLACRSHSENRAIHRHTAPDGQRQRELSAT